MRAAMFFTPLVSPNEHFSQGFNWRVGEAAGTPIGFISVTSGTCRSSGCLAKSKKNKHLQVELGRHNIRQFPITFCSAHDLCPT